MKAAKEKYFGGKSANAHMTKKHYTVSTYMCAANRQVFVHVSRHTDNYLFWSYLDRNPYNNHSLAIIIKLALFIH